MEKQSLIKYYCALFLTLVLLAGSNHAVAQTSSSSPSLTPKTTTTESPATTQNGKNLKAESSNSMLFPIIISILALAASGGVIALTILKNKEINRSIDFLKKKYNDELKSLDSKYTGLLNSQVNSQPSQPQKSISRNSSASNDNAYLEAMIECHSERISELEDKLKVTQSNQQPINYLKKTQQSYNLEPKFNPFNQIDNLSQSEVVQPLENLTYIELVNTYNTNPKLLEQTATRVSESRDSMLTRHTDNSQEIILEKANNGNYWVIPDETGLNGLLLPKDNLKIDQYRYETIKLLFDCNDYEPEYHTFKLDEPVQVSMLDNNCEWKLKKRGVLKFINPFKNLDIQGENPLIKLLENNIKLPE